MGEQKKKKTGIFYIAMFIGIALLIGFLAGAKYYLDIFGQNVPAKLEESFVQIPPGTSFDELADLLERQGLIKNKASFKQVAQWRSFVKPEMRSGRFEIKPGWSNYNLINHLRVGKQATVDVILHNERLLEHVAGKVSRYLEADSMTFLALFTDREYLEEIGYSTTNLMSLFIPNTYEFFWNTSPKGFIARMQKEHDLFWTEARKQKAADLNLSPEEVYTLASIVEGETKAHKEKPRVAGLYLNRLKKGMLLQADPTAVFATRDFDTRRVTDKHLKFDSPYNTYLYVGLPPGPIGMASINAIEAVLNAEKHDYIYMCAKADNSGLHAFAKTLSAHNVNAAKYRKWLRQRGIR